MAQRVAGSLGSDDVLVELVEDDSETSARQQITHWMRVLLACLFRRCRVGLCGAVACGGRGR